MNCDPALLESIVSQVLQKLREEGVVVNKENNGDEETREFSDITEYSLYDKIFIKNPLDEEALKILKKSTPARICIGRSGPRYLTIPWLRFRADHAAAMDAVFSEVSEEFLNKLNLFSVTTEAKNKDEYLTRPDLGRILSEEARMTIKKNCPESPNVQVIVVDGLSSKAIEENAEDFLASFTEGIKSYGLSLGRPFFIRYGRVPVMNDVGEVLKPDVVVELIGERPGLVTAKSMSVYLCWRPRSDTVESQRNVVSNIHNKGLDPVEAGAHVAGIVKKIYEQQKSGIDLIL